jgi:hypothetical protein
VSRVLTTARILTPPAVVAALLVAVLTLDGVALVAVQPISRRLARRPAPSRELYLESLLGPLLPVLLWHAVLSWVEGDAVRWRARAVTFPFALAATAAVALTIRRRERTAARRWPEPPPTPFHSAAAAAYLHLGRLERRLRRPTSPATLEQAEAVLDRTESVARELAARPVPTSRRDWLTGRRHTVRGWTWLAGAAVLVATTVPLYALEPVLPAAPGHLSGAGLFGLTLVLVLCVPAGAECWYRIERGMPALHAASLRRAADRLRTQL